MDKALDKELYKLVKKEADNIYKKSSAYKSGYIIKRYKKLGGRFKDDGKPKLLKRWFKEKWQDIGGQQYQYPIYRPTIKISKKTPLLVSEIDKKDLKIKIKEKQKIKGLKNLSPFKPKK